VVQFPADNESSFTFPRVSTIRTVFWVVRKAPDTGLRFLLGDDTEYHFHATDEGNLWGEYTSPNILDGTTRLMGNAVDGRTTVLPEGSFQLVSVVTTGDVQANTLSEDREYGRTWIGEVAEVLVYSRALTPEEEAAVGAVLAKKYALTTSYAAKSAR
jgi:hypothetical protein